MSWPIMTATGSERVSVNCRHVRQAAQQSQRPQGARRFPSPWLSPSSAVILSTPISCLSHARPIASVDVTGVKDRMKTWLPTAARRCAARTCSRTNHMRETDAVNDQCRASRNWTYPIGRVPRSRSPTRAWHEPETSRSGVVEF